MRRVATLVGSFVALLCFALSAAPATAASIPYADLLQSFQNVTSAGISLSAGGTTSAFSNPGAFRLPVTNATASTLEMQGTQLVFTQGMTTLTLSDFQVTGLPGSGKLLADVAVDGNPTATAYPLSQVFQPAPTATTQNRYVVLFSGDGAFLFNNNFGTSIQAGDQLGIIEFPVPEPTVGLLLGVGLAGGLLLRRRRLLNA